MLNGNTTAMTVASPMIQLKNIRGRGVDSSSRCMIAVANKATATAANTYPTVDASPQAPSRCGARIGMVNSHRHTRMPTSAISAATTAVAAPPDHRVLAVYPALDLGQVLVHHCSSELSWLASC